MDIFDNTPWWIYVFFIALVFLGLRATKPRTIPLNRITFLPLIFTIWNILWLNERTHDHTYLILFWVIGLIVGTFIGWQTVLAWHIYADHRRKLISLPGTWTTLVFILLVFCARYYFVYNYELHPHAAPHLYTPDAFISGLFTGIFTGRALELYHKYKNHS